MIEYELFTKAVHKIALKKPNTTSYKKFSTGKRPHISFKENPQNYRGLNDPNYGTGFETTYIPAFDNFFCVLDIDNYKNSEYQIIDAIPTEAFNTHTSKTQSGGMHLYFLSETPLKLQQHINVPIDLKAIRETSYNNGKYGGLIVADYSWKQKYDSFGEVNYIKKFYRHNNKPLLEIDFNNLVSVVYENLGLKAEKIKPKNFKKRRRTRKIGNENLKELYSLICKYFDLNLNSKYYASYRLNCRLRVLSDDERLILCNWLIQDYGELMEDINLFKHEFLKRE